MPKSVLVADDSLTMRKVIGMVLPQEDFQVTLVDNGVDAIQRARDMRFDVVLADVMMPGKSGYDVCQTLKSDPNTSHIPVLLLAGTFEPFDENRARAAGADGHVAKPFESAAFIDKVRALVGMAPGIAISPVYQPVSSAPVVAARPAQMSPAVGTQSVGQQGGPQMQRPMPQGMPGQMPQRPPQGMPGQPPMQGGMPMGARQGIPPGTVPGMRNPMMPGQMPMQGGMPMQRPPGQIPPGTVPGMRNPMMPQQGMAGGMPMQRPAGMPGGPGPGPGGFPRPPGGPMPGGVPQRRDPFGLGAPMQQGRPPAPPPQQQQHESLSLDDRPADGGEAALRNALSKASKEVIEKIAWEVVPQLAETIIREELDRLIKDRDTKH